jgi:hypothetical protein
MNEVFRTPKYQPHICILFLTTEPIFLVREIKESWKSSFYNRRYRFPEKCIQGKPRHPSVGRRYELQCSSYLILCKFYLWVPYWFQASSFCMKIHHIGLWLFSIPAFICTIPLQEVKGRGFLLVCTDIASRGFDLPQTIHIYNFELPKTATDYLHRAGRTGRKPFSKVKCSVTTLITEDEHFVLQRFQNELKFHCENLHLESMFTFNL